MGIALKAAEKIPLALLLEGRSTTKFVKAIVRDSLGIQIAGSPFSVPHLSNGFYFLDTVLMPSNVLNLVVEFGVYDDAGFTIESFEQLPASERFDLDDTASAVDALIAAATQIDLQINVLDEEKLMIEIDDEEYFDVTMEELEGFGIEVEEQDDFSVGLEEADDVEIKMEDC